MKSLGHKRGGGDFNLKGKKYRLMSCGCCAMINKKDNVRELESEKEIRNERRIRTAGRH